MNKKQFIRTVAFLLIVSTLLVTLCDLFEFKNNYVTERLDTYNRLEEDTIDAVFVGTSGIDRYWIAAKAYEEKGMTVFPYSSDGVPVWDLIPMLNEASEKQNPQLVIIDMRVFTVTYDIENNKFDSNSRRLTDAMSIFSKSRLDAVKRTLKYREMVGLEDDETTKLSFYASFIKYHNLWESDDFTFAQLSNSGSETMGFFLRPKSSIKHIGKNLKSFQTDERQSLDPIAQECMDELLDYLKGKEYKVLFIDTPHKVDEIEKARMNTMCDIFDENGFDYLLYDVEDGMLDTSVDFYNDGHVNYYGAEKFTENFSDYLEENYDLPDRRNDENCKKDWDGVYDYIKSEIKNLEALKANGDKSVG